MVLILLQLGQVGSAGTGGTNLTSSNGGNNLIHISTNGTVTTGTSANAQSSGWLIWKVPHFTANQHAMLEIIIINVSHACNVWTDFYNVSISKRWEFCIIKD